MFDLKDPSALYQAVRETSQTADIIAQYHGKPGNKDKPEGDALGIIHIWLINQGLAPEQAEETMQQQRAPLLQFITEVSRHNVRRTGPINRAITKLLPGRTHRQQQESRNQAIATAMYLIRFQQQAIEVSREYEKLRFHKEKVASIPWGEMDDETRRSIINRVTDYLEEEDVLRQTGRIINYAVREALEQEV